MGTQLPTHLMGPGAVIQVVSAAPLSAAGLITTTIAMPTLTVWTQSHGAEVLTVSITPKFANSILVVDALIHGLRTDEAYIFTALFRDSGNVIAYAQMYDPAYPAHTCGLTHAVVAGSTAPTTFKIRGGSHNTTTTYFGNAQGHASIPNSFLRVTEVAA